MYYYNKINVKTYFTFILFICLVHCEDKEVDGSYMRMDKIKHLAELRPVTDRIFEYKFLDMIFEIIVDLPAHIPGLKPYLFCPEIIFTLFLNDNNNNMYQCDAPGITSNTVTLVCQQLDVKSVTCAERHEKFMPVFLKSTNGSFFQASSDRSGYFFEVNFILLFIFLICTILLLLWLIHLQQKTTELLINNNNYNNPPRYPPVFYNQQNGVHFPLTSVAQTDDNGDQAPLIQPPAPETQQQHGGNLNNMRRNEQADEVSNAFMPELSSENDRYSLANSLKISTDEEVEKILNKKLSPTLLLDFINAQHIPVTTATGSSKKQKEDQFKFSSDNTQKSLKESSPSSPSDFDKSFEKGSTSSLEILTDDDEEWISDIKHKNKSSTSLVYRMLSHNSSVKTRLSKLYGNDLFTKAAHVVILGKNDVIAYDNTNKTLTKFPAAVDYSFYPPKVGVNYESSTVTTANITEKNHKSCLLPIKKCYTAHTVQQFYVIEIDKKERLVQAETAVIDLIRKASKSLKPKDIVAFITPAYFTEKQKNAYLHAAHNSDFWNLELVDEQLALGNSITKIAKKYFILVNCYETKAVISLFRHEIEQSRKIIELDNIEESRKEVNQLVNAISEMMKEKCHSDMTIFVGRNNRIFAALKQNYFDDSTFTLRYFENPEEMLVKGESLDLLPLRYENIALTSDAEMKLCQTIPETSKLLPQYNSVFNKKRQMLS